MGRDRARLTSANPTDFVPKWVRRGGPGSGHFEHAGIPGHRGGSLPGEAGQASEDSVGAHWFTKADDATMAKMKQAILDVPGHSLGKNTRMDTVWSSGIGTSMWMAPDGDLFEVFTHGEAAKAVIGEIEQSKIPPGIAAIIQGAAGKPGDALAIAAMSAMYGFGFVRANMDRSGLMVELAKGQALTTPQSDIVKDFLSADPNELTVDIFDIPSQKLAESIGSTATSRQRPAHALGIVSRGGPGSGHFDHAGRPGERGGWKSVV